MQFARRSHRSHDFVSCFFLSCFPNVFLKASGGFLSLDDRYEPQTDVKNRSEIYKKSIQKWTLKTIPHNVQKPLKSDAADFEKLSTVVVFCGHHTCTLDAKIENAKSQNRIQNHTKSIKKRY